MNKKMFFIFCTICLLLFGFAGCPMIFEDDLKPWERPGWKPVPLADTHTGITQGSGMGVTGIIVITLTMIDGWIKDIFIDPPTIEEWYLLEVVEDEYISLVLETNMIDVQPCCGFLETDTFDGVVAALAEAMDKNKRGNDWHITPIFKADGITLVSGTAAGSAQAGSRTVNVELEVEEGYISKVTISGGNITQVMVDFFEQRMKAQNDVIVDIFPGAQAVSIAVREAAQKALQDIKK